MKEKLIIIMLFLSLLSPFLFAVEETQAIFSHSYEEGFTNGTINASFDEIGWVATGASIQDIFGDGANTVFASCTANDLRMYNYDDKKIEHLATSDNNSMSVWANSTHVVNNIDGAGFEILTFAGGAYTFLGWNETSALATEYDVFGANGRIFVAVGTYGLALYHLIRGDCLNLRNISNNATGEYKGVWANDTHVFVVAEDDGLLVYRHTDNTLTLLDTIDDGSKYRAVTGDDKYVYTYGDEILRAYELDGTSLSLITSLPVNSDPLRDLNIYHDGSTLYVARFDNHMSAYTFDGTDFHEQDLFHSGGAINPRAVWSNGTASFTGGDDGAIYLMTGFEKFSMSRVHTGDEEYNNITTFDPKTNYTSLAILRVPVSPIVLYIETVINNTDAISADRVLTEAELVNNTFYFNPAEHVVMIGTTINPKTDVNWSVNCSFAYNVEILLPRYLEVGDYFMVAGRVELESGDSLTGYIATTHILYPDGTDAISPSPSWNCTNGNYQCIFSTYQLQPGIYSINIIFENYSTGTSWNFGETLYLSMHGSGGYSDAVVYFNFFNTDYALGLPKETLKIYINGTRINHENLQYHTYIGNTINVTVKDYYNSTVFWGNYTINNSATNLDLGLTFHSWLFWNLNDEGYFISIIKQGADRWFERGIVPFGEREFLIPSGTYCLRVYDKDHVELYNSTLPASLQVINSKVYGINGSYLQLMLDGQDTILGQLLQAITPDIVYYVPNAPRSYSILMTEGAVLGTVKLCPALIITATTYNATNASEPHNRTNSTWYPLVPNATAENGDITISKDKMEFSGYLSPNAPMWVNVSIVEGATNDLVSYKNYSAIPPPITLRGENVSVNCSMGEIYIKRTTTYQAETKFLWSMNIYTLFHEATIDVTNHFTNITLYDVYVRMFLHENSTPATNTFELWNQTGGVQWTEGINYDSSARCISWAFSFLPRNITYSFKAVFYSVDATIMPTDAVHVVEEPGYAEHEGIQHYYIKARWRNPKASSFKGALHIQFRFNKPRDIAAASFDVYDMDRDYFLFPEEFILGTYGVTIIQDVMGIVNPNHARNFEIYYLLVKNLDEAGSGGGVDVYDPTGDNIFRTTVIYGPINLGFFFAMISCMVGLISFRQDKKQKPMKNILGMLGVFFTLIFIVLGIA